MAEADRGGGATVGDRADEIRLHGRFASQFDADLAARLIDRAAAENAVGTREIDVLEQAEARGAALEGEVALDAVGGDDHHLTGLDLAYQLGPDDVERAGFGRQHPTIAKLAQNQRPDAQRIAAADQLGPGHRNDGKGTLAFA